MGKFDLDDVLKELGGIEAGLEHDGTDQASADNRVADSKEPAVDTETDHPDLDQVIGAPSVKSDSTNSGVPIFVRNDPSETPRPPDLTGRGLGEEATTSMAADDANPNRIRPTDALREIYSPEEDGISQEQIDLGSCLVEREVITAELLTSAQRVIKQSPGKPLADTLIEMGAFEADIQAIVAEINRLSFERLDLDQEDVVDLKLLNRLGADFCRQAFILPLRKEGTRLVVGTASPDDVFLLDDVKRRLKVSSVKHVLLTRADIRAVLDTATDAEAEEYNIDELLSDVEEDDVEVLRASDEDKSVDDEADSSPVVRYVNHIIQTALKEGASDIHIEPEEKALKVRFRIDGVLYEVLTPPKKLFAAITSRIKIMANLDIAERRLPQDGRIRANVHGRKVDLRVSTVPTARGEKTVLRILDNRAIQVPLEDLGFSTEHLTHWKHQITQPHGIILVTGPTGSGKTTTLYSSLQQMDLRKLNVATVEDPVEYQIGNITQIQTHERIGLTFSNSLRSLMRQDPDVIMIGEIRDQETATIAIQASLTGHLVLSTLHTNDAPSSLTRLINIGIEPFLISSAVSTVLAQRLVRCNCSHCLTTSELPKELEDLVRDSGVDANNIKQSTGCERCRNTGYQGRVGLYELLHIDDTIRDSIVASPNVTELRNLCVQRGMITLRQDGFSKVDRGITTIDEVLRVTEDSR